MPLGMSYKPPGPPPPTASCYICLENSADSSIDQPLLRNCACRGDAGWAHITCLAEFAASKVTEAQREQDHSVHIASFWADCILCKTQYMQNMGLAMAEAFVNQYEHLPDTDPRRSSSLYALASSRDDVGDYDGAIELYERLLQMCNFLATKGTDMRKQEGDIFGKMGAVLMRADRLDDALPILERLRELWVAEYGPNSPNVKITNRMIDRTKERIEILGGRGHQKRDSAAELVEERERFRENQECVDIRHRLFVHLRLVYALKSDGRHQESMEELEKLVVESRQILGPDHPDTQNYENEAVKYRQRMLQLETPMASNSSSAAGAATSQKKDVWAVIDYEKKSAIHGRRVKVLKATKNDAGVYICQIKNDKGVSSKVKVAQNQFILEKGTTIMVHGLVSSTNLNGSIGIIRSFHKEKCRYAISVGKKKTAVSIKPSNLNVVFN